MANLGFYYNQDACTGCRACQVSCKDKNDLPVGALYRRVRDFEQGSYPAPGYYHYSWACNHCANPACVANCPTGAMHVAEDGTVLPDDELCIACKTCQQACPYDVPFVLETLNVTRKCDACADLRARGEKPVCVASCTMRALDFGDLDELEAKYGDGLVQEIPVLPNSSETNPSILINPRACALEEDFVETMI
ncbi:MAG: 4Fe-4S dicluster domain-containing protein [Eggerthellaceae bacterium]|nr:4Fe-4S dicluster domain-containing protein [Eggerthellaceae bacterium]